MIVRGWLASLSPKGLARGKTYFSEPMGGARTVQYKFGLLDQGWRKPTVSRFNQI